jgi:hypothetical protein
MKGGGGWRKEEEERWREERWESEGIEGGGGGVSSARALRTPARVHCQCGDSTPADPPASEQRKALGEHV